VKALGVNRPKEDPLAWAGCIVHAPGVRPPARPEVHTRRDLYPGGRQHPACLAELQRLEPAREANQLRVPAARHPDRVSGARLP